MQDISWVPMLMFLAAIFGFALIEHLRTRPAKRAYRCDFRRMRSPAERARRRAMEPVQAQRGFPAPQPVARRGFAR
jgi:hypothetical protein